MGHEQSADDSRISAIAQRNELWAERARMRTARRVQSLLERHRDIITAEVAAMIASREGERAHAAMLQARAEGLANDNMSMTPGLVAYLTAEGLRQLEQQAQSPAGPDYLSYYTAAMRPVGEDNNLFVLELPEGVYTDAGSRCLLTDRSSRSLSQGQAYRDEQSFYVDFRGIVRIECNGGELWQNPHMSADGTPR